MDAEAASRYTTTPSSELSTLSIISPRFPCSACAQLGGVKRMQLANRFPPAVCLTLRWRCIESQGLSLSLYPIWLDWKALI